MIAPTGTPTPGSSGSAGSSEPGGRIRPGATRRGPWRLLLVFFLVGVAFGSPRPLAAKVYLTTAEALSLVFGEGCAVERRVSYLDEEQLAEASRIAGDEIESGFLPRYHGRCDGTSAGIAYFDTHRVRTLPETLMIHVDPEGRIGRIEVVSFKEPPEYKAPARWYAQFRGLEIGAGLALGREVQPIAGATLTARAAIKAVRRVLALHEVLSAPGDVTAPAAGTDTELR